jgi:hypothetical protein
LRERAWKWMVPALAVSPGVAWWYLAAVEWGWGIWSTVPAGFVLVMSLAALLNGITYYREKFLRFRADALFMESSTPEVRMMEAAKAMHPEAVKALLAHRRTIWRIKYVPRKDLVDWVLDEAPSVHAGFVDFVLDRSSGVLMSKRLLSEGSTRFDPEGLVTDYQQYDDLLHLMRSKLMCTEAFGNQPPHLLPPWTVETIRHRFGLDGEGYEAAETEEVRMQNAEGRMQSAEGRAPKVVGDVPPVIEKALEGLEQTQLMKARMRGS